MLFGQGVLNSYLKILMFYENNLLNSNMIFQCAKLCVYTQKAGCLKVTKIKTMMSVKVLIAELNLLDLINHDGGDGSHSPRSSCGRAS